MNEGVAVFIVIMTSISAIAWLLNSWIKTRGARHDGGTIAAGAVDGGRDMELLSVENEGLKGQVSRLEERLAVLERIATDPAERTAREIESLRDARN